MDFICSMVEKNKTRLVLLLLVSLTIIACSPLSLDTWFKGGDSIIHLIRSNDVCYEMSIGNYYPRFLSQACFGKGLPTLNFYPPAFYLLVGYLNAAGLHIITAMVLVCATSFFLSGWGMYLWTKKYCGEIGALIAATIYLFAPYHLVDIYLRGAVPEFMALAILPYLFHGIDLSFASERSLRGIIYTGLASAAIVLTHNLTAVMIFPFALCYFVWCRFYFKASYRTCAAACLGPLVGVGLSAFYWMPVMFEKKYLLGTGVSIVGNLHYSSHFNSIAAFFGSREVTAFTFNSLYALVFLCAAVSMTALTSCKDKKIQFGLLTIVCCFLSVMMTLSLATPVYEAVPTLQYLQFPYRFLGPATLFLSAFCGFVPCSRLLAGRKNVTSVVCALIIASCIFLSGSMRKVEGPLPSFPPNPVPFSKESYSIFMTWSDGDFMPVDSGLTRGETLVSPVVLSSGGVAQPLADCRIVGAKLSCRVDLQQEAELVGPWFYFPGWEAKYDNNKMPVYPDKYGLVAVTIPKGAHDVEIRFGTTWPRVAGWIVAGITLLVAVSCALFFRSRQGTRQEIAANDG
jgi:hypothetical protein